MILVNIYEDLFIWELVYLINYSLFIFKWKFQEVFVDSLVFYIKQKRFEKVVSLLLVFKDRVFDICYDCGFNIVDNFFRFFKKVYGFLLVEFRNQVMS